MPPKSCLHCYRKTPSIFLLEVDHPMIANWHVCAECYPKVMLNLHNSVVHIYGQIIDLAACLRKFRSNNQGATI